MSSVTSFSPLPAMKRDLFFMWDVFFLGTARRTDSQMSPSSEGTLRRIEAGIAKAIVGRIGVEMCLEKRVVEREAADAAGAERRGSRKERIDDVDCAAAILNRLGTDVATVAHTMVDLGDLYMKLYKFAMSRRITLFVERTDHANSRGRTRAKPDVAWKVPGEKGVLGTRDLMGNLAITSRREILDLPQTTIQSHFSLVLNSLLLIIPRTFE